MNCEASLHHPSRNLFCLFSSPKDIPFKFSNIQNFHVFLFIILLSQFIQIIDSTLRHHCLKYAEEKLDPWDINGNYLRKDLMVKYILRNVVSIFFLLALGTLVCCCCCCCCVASVMSDSMQPQRQQATRLPHPCDSTGRTLEWVAISFQCMKVKSESEVAQSRPTLSDPMDCSPPGSCIHGIFQARVLERGAIASCSRIHQERAAADNIAQTYLDIECLFIYFFLKQLRIS